MVLLGSLTPFAAGGLAGCIATCVVLPFDTLKVALQLQRGQGSSIVAVLTTIRTGGVRKLWGGLEAALTRQVIYTSSRMGIYASLTAYISQTSARVSFLDKIASAALAGGLSALLSTPADLALTRIQANNSKPKELRQNLGGVWGVLKEAWKEGGLKGVYRGASPTVVRAVLLNMGMLAVGDELKQQFSQSLPAPYALVLSSVIAGLVCAVVSLPADLIKTRLQSQKSGGEFSGMRHCAIDTWKKEGPSGFFRGLVPYCVRIAPHGVITLILTPYFASILAQY